MIVRPSSLDHRRQGLGTPKISAAVVVADTTKVDVGMGSKFPNTADNAGSSTGSGSSSDDGENGNPGETAHIKYSANWSGAIVHGTEFETVAGTLAVPLPHAPSDSDPDIFYGASAWVGFDGDSSCPSVILQVGIDFNIQNGTPMYDAWFEWYPDYSYNFAGFLLHAGDVVTLTATAINTTSGSVLVENHTTGESAMHTFVGEEQPLCQSSAEWIVEDYSVGGRLVDLCDWGRATFTDCEAKQASGATASLSNATVYEITNDRGKLMTDCSISGSSIVTCEYIG
ncbi:MAG: hypothetical protein STHCBS139747_007094 [Sporothrix thermara]